MSPAQVPSPLCPGESSAARGRRGAEGKHRARLRFLTKPGTFTSCWTTTVRPSREEMRFIINYAHKSYQFAM